MSKASGAPTARVTYLEFAERVDPPPHCRGRGAARATNPSLSPDHLEPMVVVTTVRLGAIAAPSTPEVGRVRLEKQIVAAGALLVLDNFSMLGPPRRTGEVSCVVAPRPPLGRAAPREPAVEDSALMYCESGSRPERPPVHCHPGEQEETGQRRGCPPCRCGRRRPTRFFEL